MILLQNDAGFLFASEKIFTVMTVIIVIFAGFILYLFLTERKLRKLEDKLKSIQISDEQIDSEKVEE